MFFPAILVKALVKKAALPTGNFKRSPHAAVHLWHGQAAEFRDTQPRVKENVGPIVASAVMLIRLDELQQIPFLLPGDGLPGHRVIDDHRGQFKLKRILADHVIVHRHLECRSENASNRINRAIPSAIHLLKLDEPCFGIRQAHLVNVLPAERLFFHSWKSLL